LAGTPEIASFLTTEISRDTYINIMDQYRPCYRISNQPPLDRRVTGEEYRRAVRQAKEAGLHRFDRREPRFLQRL
jgi:putative pyruvate formate lyase activating enzyme